MTSSRNAAGHAKGPASGDYFHACPKPPQPVDHSACAHAGAFEILERCHEHITQRLEVLEEVARSLRDAQKFRDEHLAVLGDIISFLDTAVPLHTADEEQTLFPMLRKHPQFAEATTTPMDCMESDHRRHMDTRRTLDTAIVKRDVQATVRCAMNIAASYREHMQKENEVLFPVARQLLTDPAVIAWMTEEMRGRRRAAGLIDC